MNTARYIGILDGTAEESLPQSMQHELRLFNLLRPIGIHKVGATLTEEDLMTVAGIKAPARLTVGDTI